jgi:hypothetical protein
MYLWVSRNETENEKEERSGCRESDMCIYLSRQSEPILTSNRTPGDICLSVHPLNQRQPREPEEDLLTPVSIPEDIPAPMQVEYLSGQATGFLLEGGGQHRLPGKEKHGRWIALSRLGPADRRDFGDVGTAEMGSAEDLMEIPCLTMYPHRSML